MASLKEMRNRIGSVKATQKITKAMQMVAAAKLKRAQDQAVAARPYASRMAAVIANLAAGVSGDGAPKLLAGTGSDQRHLIVVASSDKGMAGGFSSNIIRAARAALPHVYLGYRIMGCASMRYKAGYRPHELLQGLPGPGEEPHWVEAPDA